MMYSNFEKAMAAACVIIAAVLAFLALLISNDNDIAAGVLMAMAQFLVLAASILHIDYKLLHYGQEFFGSKRNEKQQPSEHSALAG